MIEALDIFYHVEHNHRCTWIDGNICPLCQQKKGKFHVHHVVWKSEGGRSWYANQLKVCTRCHAILTAGEEIEDKALDILASRFMRAWYGVLFDIQILKAERDKKAHDFDLHWGWYRATLVMLGRCALDLIKTRDGTMDYVRLFAAIKNNDVQDEFDRIDKLANFACDQAKTTFQLPSKE